MTTLTLHAEPRARAARGLRRNEALSLSSRELHLRFSGALDARSRVELQSAAARAVRRAPTSPSVHIDLDDVTALDDRAVESLNQAWVLFTRRGWSVTVTGPTSPDAGLHFVGPRSPATSHGPAGARLEPRTTAGPQKPWRN